MKHLLIIFFLGFSLSAFAQKSDTLNIPVGKYKFIKVGDKVYKLVTTLEEVKPQTVSDSTSLFRIWDGHIITPTPNYETPAIIPNKYYLNNTNF